MREARRDTSLARMMLMAAGLAVSVCVFVGLFPAAKEAQAATSISKKLAALEVRPEGTMDGYSRDLFPHWSNAREYGWTLPSGTPDPESCDARDAALIRDGRGEVVQDGCYVAQGTWFDPYTGNTYYEPSEIDIDHVVPLANAWRSGASAWTTEERERFANVPSNLLSVEDNANASKGDKGPEAWKPPRKAYHCTYAKKWINIKHYWKLSVTSSEKSALKRMLSTCR